METIKISKVQFVSRFSGLGNIETIPYSYPFADLSMISGGTTTQRVSISVGSSTTLKRVQVQLDGLDSAWYPVAGQFLWYNNPVVAIATQLIVITTVVSGSNFVLSVTRSNESLGTITLSAFTLRVKIRILRSPF